MSMSRRMFSFVPRPRSPSTSRFSSTKALTPATPPSARHPLAALAPPPDPEVLAHEGPNLRDLALGQVPDLRVRIHTGLGYDLLGRRATDPIDVCEPDLDPLFAWQVHARYTCHR